MPSAVQQIEAVSPHQDIKLRHFKTLMYNEGRRVKSTIDIAKSV